MGTVCGFEDLPGVALHLARIFCPHHQSLLDHMGLMRGAARAEQAQVDAATRRPLQIIHELRLAVPIQWMLAAVEDGDIEIAVWPKETAESAAIEENRQDPGGFPFLSDPPQGVREL